MSKKKSLFFLAVGTVAGFLLYKYYRENGLPRFNVGKNSKSGSSEKGRRTVVKTRKSRSSGPSKSRTNDAVLSLMEPGQEYTKVELAKKLGVSDKTVQRKLNALQKEGRVKARGTTRNKVWVVV